MGVKTGFDVKVFVDHPEFIPELKARLSDLSPMLENVIEEWADLNEQKFDKAMGQEATGVSMDVDVPWLALTSRYMQRKRGEGYVDWLMVRTGALKDSLTNPESFFHEANEAGAVFGAPLSELEENKVDWNWEKRPTVFFGYSDMMMLTRHLGNYLGFGADYKNILFERGLERAALRKEAASLEMELNERFNTEE